MAAAAQTPVIDWGDEGGVQIFLCGAVSSLLYTSDLVLEAVLQVCCLMATDYDPYCQCGENEEVLCHRLHKRAAGELQGPERGSQ